MTPAAGVPWRPLAALTAGVLAVHWLVLEGAPERLAWDRPSPQVVRATLPVPASAPEAPQPPEEAVAIDAGAALPQRPVATVPPAAPRAAARPSPQAARGPAVATAPAPPATQPTVVLPSAALWRYEARALHRGVLLQGTAQLDWQPSGTGYEAQLQIDVPPLPRRVQRSTGRVTPEGLEPLRHSDRSRGEQATHFDREKGIVVFSSNRPGVALQAGAQDRVSVLVQLAGIAAADPSRLRPGTVVALQTAGTREAERWEYVVEGLEELALPGGTLQALKFTRSPQREYDLRLELWLGPGPDYAPVRLRLTPPNGDWLDMQWSGTDKR